MLQKCGHGASAESSQERLKHVPFDRFAQAWCLGTAAVSAYHPGLNLDSEICPGDRSPGSVYPSTRYPVVKLKAELWRGLEATQHNSNGPQACTLMMRCSRSIPIAHC